MEHGREKTPCRIQDRLGRKIGRGLVSSLASSAMRFPRMEIFDCEPVCLTHPNPVGPTRICTTPYHGSHSIEYDWLASRCLLDMEERIIYDMRDTPTCFRVDF